MGVLSHLCDFFFFFLSCTDASRFCQTYTDQTDQKLAKNRHQAAVLFARPRRSRQASIAWRRAVWTSWGLRPTRRSCSPVSFIYRPPWRSCRSGPPSMNRCIRTCRMSRWLGETAGGGRLELLERELGVRLAAVLSRASLLGVVFGVFLNYWYNSVWVYYYGLLCWYNSVWVYYYGLLCSSTTCELLEGTCIVRGVYKPSFPWCWFTGVRQNVAG